MNTRDPMTRLLHILTCLLVACLLLPGSVLAAKSKVAKKKPVFSEQTSATIRPLAVLNEMKHWSNPDYTRISLELDRDVTWEAHQLGKDSPGKPGRVYIDINHARLGRNVRDVTIGDGLLRGARVGQYKPDVVRVVLDTENIKDFKIFPLSEPARLIIDVRGERPVEISRLEPVISSAPEPLAETQAGRAAGSCREKTAHAEKTGHLQDPPHRGRPRPRRARPGRRRPQRPAGKGGGPGHRPQAAGTAQG